MKRIIWLFLLGCGAKAAPARVPDTLLPSKPPHAQVVDVATLDPPPVGFQYATTLHRAGTTSQGSVTQDGSWTVEYTAFTDKAPSGLRVAIDHLTTTLQSSDGKTSNLPFALSGETVLLSTSAKGSELTHEDGSPTSADEQQSFVAFYGQGGTYLPGRDVLIGKKLEKGIAIDMPEAVPGIALMNPPSAPTQANVTLEQVSPDGQATIDLDASGDAWSIQASLVTNADTLLPASLDVKFSMTGPTATTSELKQTFTYPSGA